MAEKAREHYFCEHCNRVLWVGDECDCPGSQKGKPKPKQKDEEQDGQP